MKKIIRLFAIILCVMVCAFSLTACSDAGAPKHSVSDPKLIVDESYIEDTLADFLTANPDRTAFSDGEAAAALYLAKKLASFGYDEGNVVIQSFGVLESEVEQLSQNVYATYTGSTDENAKTVVVGAYYDNVYSKAYKRDSEDATRAEGALSNGTGVAAALCVAEYLAKEKPDLGFNVYIVFFGASATSSRGAQKFIDGIGSRESSKITFMAELQRLGCDNVYAYTDSRKTKRTAFFDRIAADNALNIYKPTQKSPIMPALYALDGIPYFQWAQSGVYRAFFNAGIPTLNLIGGSWETIDFTDEETVSGKPVSYTNLDTLASLRENCPEYGSRIASAATLVIKSLTDGEFLSVMEYDKANFPNTDVLMKQWIWHLIVIAVLIVALGVCTLITGRMAKKYPVVYPRPANIKMAVFGMDYEDKNSADVFIDIRHTGEGDIFPGIPNNESDVSSSRKDEVFPDYPDDNNDGGNDNSDIFGGGGQ